MADIFKKFNSIKEFNRYLDTNPTQPHFVGEESSKNCRASWAGTESYEEATKLLMFGDRELQREIESQGVAKERIKLAKFANRRQVYSSIVGFAPNVPNYIAGVPNAMINARQQRVKQNVVNVYYNIATGCNISADNIRKSVSKVCCALLRLEASGVRVNLYTGDCCFKGKQNLSFAVKVKDSGQPLDTLKMCYPLAHPSFLRRQYLRFAEVTKGLGKSWVGSYGYPHTYNDKVKDILSHGGLHVDVVLNYYTVRAMSVDEITKKLALNK